MRTAFTDLVGAQHPLVGFNRSPGVVAAVTNAGHHGALALESFFIGQVVGSFTSIRSAADITRQIVTECERRIAELGALL